MSIDIVVADDLTGTSDTLVQFLACAGRAIVFPSLRGFEHAVHTADLPAGDLAIGVSTESRHLAPDVAARRVMRAHRAARRLSPRLQFQKVDSALRGNAGAEVAAYRRVTGAPRVLMTPAFLPSGRTVRGGLLYVNGVPLAQSEVASDLRTPMADSDVAALLQRQTDVTIVNLPAPGPAGPCADTIAALGSAPPGIVVADAESQTDLEALARLVIAAGLQHAVAGSAGLAGQLGRLLGEAPSARRLSMARHGRRILVVFGSPHPQAVAQAGTASDVLGIPIRRPGSAGAPGRLAVAIDALRKDLATRGVALLTGPAAVPESRLEPATVAGALARTARRLVEDGVVDALIVSGGDVAAAVCAALDVGWIELLEQVFPGAPLGRIEGGSAAGVTLVTKSGAHGDDAGLVTILRRLAGAADLRA